jgi:hypothetical protein
MSNYTKSTNFATKDNLSPGNPLKIVKGTEIDTEFNNIQTAVATKTDNASANITGGSITGITDLAVADGGTGASTATAALNNLLPSQTSNANKYLQTDGTNASWDAVSLSTADITGTLPVANGGTGVTSSTGTGSVVLSNSPTLVTPALGTPASGTATNLTGLPISTGVSGLGTGVATFLGTPSSANLASAVTDETGSGALVFANSPTLVTPALGTPSALVGTNITGTASGLTAGNVTTNANLTGAITSTGNATSLGSFSSANLLGALTDETGSGSAVFATSPTLVTPILGTPTSATLTNATGLPIATGVSGLGTGVATALAVNVGSSGAPLVNGGVLGTPSSGTATNLTGLPLSTGVTGTLPVANGGTGTATPSIVAGTNVTVTGTWPNQTIAASGSSGTVTSVDVSGGTTGLTTSGGPVTSSGTVTLAGTLAVANGGTGQTSYTDGQLLIGNSTGNTLTKATLTAGTNVTITNAAGAITIAASGGGASAATPTALGTVYATQTSGGGTPYLTAFGYNAGVSTTGAGNTAMGTQALQANTNATFSTAVGYQAAYSLNGSNGYTTAIGYQALYTQSSGYSNTAVGYQSGYLMETGIQNSMTGLESLKANTTGSYNSAFGTYALNSNTTASNAVAVGYQALYSNTTGVRVTAVGYKAGYSHTDSGGNGENTYVGYLAGTASTGYYNTIIGSRAGEALATGGNANTFLGINAGNYSTAITTGSSNIMIGALAGASSAAASGQFVIGTTVVSQGDATITIGSPAGKIYNSYGVNATWTQTSDERLKQDINSDTLGLSFINRLRPVTYSWKPSNEIDQSLPQYNEVNQRTTGVVMHGLIAQEVKAALDAEGVTTFAGWDMGSDGVQSISREMFISPLIKAIQELKAEFDAYKASHP